MTIGASKAVIDESLNIPIVNSMFEKYQQAMLELATIKGVPVGVSLRRCGE